MDSLRRWFGKDADQIHTLILQPDCCDDHDNGFGYGYDVWKGHMPNKLLKVGTPEFERALDQEFENGFGTAHVPPFLAWSKRFVYCRHEYDGSTSLVRLPVSVAAFKEACK